MDNGKEEKCNREGFLFTGLAGPQGTQHAASSASIELTHPEKLRDLQGLASGVEVVRAKAPVDSTNVDRSGEGEGGGFTAPCGASTSGDRGSSLNEIGKGPIEPLGSASVRPYTVNPCIIPGALKAGIHVSHMLVSVAAAAAVKTIYVGPRLEALGALGAFGWNHLHAAQQESEYRGTMKVEMQEGDQ
ncbi:hypothetical protein BDQ17DRAFT_1436336 [Cyathus striatus]|nr:hypothetical protein BDQ17DRAFT_1436336 [Cyathus striatus]